MGYQGKIISRSRALMASSALTPVAIVAAGMMLWTPTARALPQDGQVVGGAATITQTSATKLDITQTTGKAIVEWRSFSIGQGEHVNFNQPSSSSLILNRVTGGEISSILGRMTANGTVMLVNHSGIVFGNGAQIDVNGLVATTANIRNENFMSGNYKFDMASPIPDAAVKNFGTITIGGRGLGALVAPSVQNSGIIQAHLGKVALGSGSTFALDLYGDQLISFDAGSKIGEIGIDHLVNSGTISADGGTVLLSAAAAEGVVNKVINMSGVVEARSIDVSTGKIVLNGGDTGIVAVSGTLDASGRNAGEQGGTVKVLGQKVGLFDGARIDAAGDAGGGTALVGGNWQGKGPEANAQFAYVAPSAMIDVSALTNGDGGKAVVWADNTTRFNGTIFAKGGAQGGNGGMVETSGKGNLSVGGTARVDASASRGQGGEWLLDPTNIEVATGGAATYAQVDQFADAGATNTIDPSALDAVGGNVTLQASTDITFTNAVTLTTAGASISAYAGDDILVNAAITTNNGAILLSANDSGGTQSGVGRVVANGIAGALNAGTAGITVTTNGSPGLVDGGSGLQTAINLSSAVLTSGAASSFSAGAGGIFLANASNNFTGAVSLSNSGANNVSLRDTNALDLGTVGVGSGTLTVQSGGNLTQSGVITQAAGAGAASFTAGANAITLANASNNFTGAVSLSNSGANTVQLRDINALDLGTVSVGSGTLTVQSGGAITQSGALTAYGTSSFTAGANAITLANASNDFTQAVYLSNSGANNVSLRDVNALELGTVGVGSGTLTVQSGGALTQSGVITQAAGAGAASFTAGANAITLANASNDFTGAVSLSNSGASNVSLRDTNALDLGTVGVGSGTLTVQSGGNITQSGVLTQASGAGAASFTAGANAISLYNASNDFTGAVNLSNSGANTVQLRDINALDLGTVSVGALLVQLGGALTQSGVITVAGAGGAEFNAGAAITLDNASNDFTGTVVLSNSGANNVSLRDTNALDLGTVGVGSGTLTVQSGGAITQSGVLTVLGTSSFTAGANAITLANASNNFVGAVSLSNSGANNVSLRDTSALDLGTVGVGSGTLTVQSGGALTQSGAITQAAGAGAASFTAGANVITLANASNDFTGAVSLSNSGANNVSLRDTNALDLGTVGVGSGTLTVQSGGALTQSGVITQAAGAGAASFTAGANAITLANASNDFTGAVSLSNSGANAVAIRDTNAISFSTIGVGNTLDITAGGAITLYANVTSGSHQTFTGAVVILGNGTLGSTGGNISFSSTVDDGIANSHNLTVSAGAGTVTFSGAVGTTKLAGLDLSGTTGTTKLYGNVTTGGTQSYGGAVQLYGNSTLTTTNSNVTFSSTVNDQTANTHSMAVSAGTGTLSFGNVVGGTASLASLDLSGTTGNITLNGNVTTGGAQSYGGKLVLTEGSLIAIDSTSGGATGSITLSKAFVGTAGGASESLTINAGAGGDVSISQVVDATAPLGGLTITARDVAINNAVNNGSGAVSITARELDFGGTFSGTGALTIKQLAGNALQLGGADPGISTLTLDSTDLTNLSSGFSSVTLGNTSGASALTTGGAISLSNPTTFQAGASGIALSYNVTGNDSTESLTFASAVTLGGASTVATTNGAVSFQSTVNGANGLTVNAGTGSATFTGAVGASTAPTSLSVTSGTATTGSTVNAGSVAFANSGTLTIGGDMTATTGDLTMNDASYAGVSVLTLQSSTGKVQVNSGKNLTSTGGGVKMLASTTTSGDVTVPSLTISGVGTLTGSVGGGRDQTAANRIALTAGGSGTFNGLTIGGGGRGAEAQAALEKVNDKLKLPNIGVTVPNAGANADLFELAPGGTPGGGRAEGGDAENPADAFGGSSGPAAGPAPLLNPSSDDSGAQQPAAKGKDDDEKKKQEGASTDKSQSKGGA